MLEWTGLKNKRRFVITIAGSDSCAGAGIQADLKTFATQHVEAATVITAVTSQNKEHILKINLCRITTVRHQLEAVLATNKVTYIKIGMVVNKAIIDCLAQCLANRYRLIVDPLFVSSSKQKLLFDCDLPYLAHKLHPYFLTPNLSEAILLSNDKLTFHTDPHKICHFLHQKYQSHILLTGIKNQKDVRDYYYDGYNYYCYQHKQNDHEFHGTGCVLSSALCALLAKGYKPHKAVSKAITFLQKVMHHSKDGRLYI